MGRGRRSSWGRWGRGEGGLLLAGPGSGKTAVLTLRILRLLEEDDNASSLSLTFTNKAASLTTWSGSCRAGTGNCRRTARWTLSES